MKRCFSIGGLLVCLAMVGCGGAPAASTTVSQDDVKASQEAQDQAAQDEMAHRKAEAAKK